MSAPIGKDEEGGENHTEPTTCASGVQVPVLDTKVNMSVSTRNHSALTYRSLQLVGVVAVVSPASGLQPINQPTALP